ncbi:MAG: hypothetical protein HC896_03955 [Bacteroidales bacterium]|nr:hypothetical protein [Bacteroidales bacterium]
MDNMLLVAGAGQNVGKTTFICEVLQKFNKLENIVAIKVSSHPHILKSGVCLWKQGEASIYKETISNHKDTGRYLAAGASGSYLVQSRDTGFMQAFQQLLPEISGRACLMESALYLNYYQPALFFYLFAQTGSENTILHWLKRLTNRLGLRITSLILTLMHLL